MHRKHEPGRGETNHLGCGSTYFQYLEGIVQAKRWNETLVENGKKNEQQQIYTGVPLSEDEMQAVISLSVDADRDLTESYREYVEATKHYMEEQHLEVMPSTLPEKLETLHQRHREVVELYIARLRSQIGEEAFQRLDRILAAKTAAPTVIK